MNSDPKFYRGVDWGKGDSMGANVIVFDPYQEVCDPYQEIHRLRGVVARLTERNKWQSGQLESLAKSAIEREEKIKSQADIIDSQKRLVQTEMKRADDFRAQAQAYEKVGRDLEAETRRLTAALQEQRSELGRALLAIGYLSFQNLFPKSA